MPVSAPGWDQAARYWARSSVEKVPGRLERRSDREPMWKLKAEKRASGSQGSWKKNMYQLRRNWRGRVLRKFRITEGWGGVRSTSLEMRGGWRRAALQGTAGAPSWPGRKMFFQLRRRRVC